MMSMSRKSAGFRTQELLSETVEHDDSRGLPASQWCPGDDGTATLPQTSSAPSCNRGANFNPSRLQLAIQELA